LKREFLQPLSVKYDFAPTFLSGVEKGQPTKFFEHSQLDRVGMMSLFTLIILSSQDSGADPDWLIVHVSGILQRAFEKRKAGKRVNLKPEVLRRVDEAVDLLNDMEDLQSQINLATGIREVSRYELAKEVSKRKTLDCDNWTLDDLAEFAGMSKYAFQKAFKELYNCTVKEYPRDLAWQSALTMLLRGSTNLKRISTFVSFHKQRSFSSAFKQRFGMAPVEYAQEYEKKFLNYKNSVHRNPGENLECSVQGS
jgi:AraC-like DNA-binding protein